MKPFNFEDESEALEGRREEMHRQLCALLAGRSYISPHDVKTIAHEVLRHRILVTYEAEAEGKNSDDVIDVILNNVEVP